MKRLFTVFILVLVLTGACRKTADGLNPYSNSTTCGVKNPAQNLRWLRDRIEEFQVSVVRVADYKGETYINLYAYIWSCTICHTYRCDGSLVDFQQMSTADQQEIHSRLWSKEATVIYKRSE